MNQPEPTPDQRSLSNVIHPEVDDAEGSASGPGSHMVRTENLSVTNRSIFNSLRELLDMIRFEHTVFALPFALLGALAAAEGLPPWRTSLWILAAMVGARTAAMTFNRLVDEDLDAANPRTASRALPAGRVDGGRHHFFFWGHIGRCPGPANHIGIPRRVDHPFGEDRFAPRFGFRDNPENRVALYDRGDKQPVQHGADVWLLLNQRVRDQFETFGIDLVGQGL